MTLVVKIGGHAIDSLEPTSPVLRDLAEDIQVLKRSNEPVVVVHGGGPQIASLLASVGKPSVFKDGFRLTDDETMEYVAMALSLVNLHIVAALNNAGTPAVGLSGPDASLLTAQPIGEEFMRAGKVPSVVPLPLQLLLDGRLTPVVSPVSVDEEGKLLNCNADSAAGAVAKALGASLILLSDIDQVRSDPDDPASALGSVSRAEVNDMLNSGAAREGMRPKVQAALDALDGGAPSVVIANGTRRHALAASASRQIPITEITQ